MNKWALQPTSSRSYHSVSDTNTTAAVEVFIWPSSRLDDDLSRALQTPTF